MSGTAQPVGMVAVVITRDGKPPVGGDEAVAECSGRAIVIDVDGLRPAALAASLVSDLIEFEVVVLPASPDGRDLAPRLAALLSRPLLAGAIAVSPGEVLLARRAGLVIERHEVDGPFVATLQPGVRGVPAAIGPLVSTRTDAPLVGSDRSADPVVMDVTTPDASDLDLVEATNIMAAGAGLRDAGFVDLAVRVAAALGMSLGATRVVTDRGWLPFERQIGTTGVMVDPEIYVALAISGAVQHISGLGEPQHVVSVNTDGNCPMAAMAETNLVVDARAALVALADRLDIEVEVRLRAVVQNVYSAHHHAGETSHD